MNRVDCKSIVARNHNCRVPEFQGSGFPGANGDINTHIIILCDGRTLVRLKGVSSEFNHFLTNGCFEIIFNIQHPHLVPYKHLFSNLRSSNPDKCWMIACCYFSERSKQLPQPLYQEGAAPVLKPLELELELQSKDLEMQIKKICGSGYFDQDPNSPLGKARLAYEEHRIVGNQIWSRWEMEEVRKKSYSDRTWMDCAQATCGLSIFMGHAMRGMVMSVVSDLLQGTLGLAWKWQQLTTAQGKVLCDLHFLENLPTAKLCDRNGFECQFFSMPCKYYPSEEILGRVLANAHLYKKHLQPLIEEHYEVVELEDACMHHLRLQNCVALIQNINDGFEEASLDALASIAETINALPCRWKTRVWQALYNQCAQGMNEDRWSENHFPEYLPELEFILREIIKDCHHRLLGSLSKEYSQK